MRKSACLFLLLTSAGFSMAQQPPAATQFNGDTWWSYVKFLADDSLEGRDTGSEGLRKAQAYAVEQFEKAGLEPAGTKGFYQSIRLREYQVDESKSSLTLRSDGKAKHLTS